MTKSDTYFPPASRQITIGALTLGGGNPLVLQTMANSNTLDLQACKEQFEKMQAAGAQMIRFTTPALRDVKSLEKLIEWSHEVYPAIPVVADVHFNASVAFEAARICDKVRVNPGNFTGKRGLKTNYSESDYRAEGENIKQQLSELLDICRSNHTALRIGVNHGSLSDRIMSRFGDTPEGMVESAMEFLRICRDAGFFDVVVSLKSSNTMLMVQSVRLLVKTMLQEDLYFPLHLGVTESGAGLEGRVRSVVGIAALLQEGFGDTIRISLTEPPEEEIPVAKMLGELFPRPASLPYHPLDNLPWDPFHFNKPEVNEVFDSGRNLLPLVICGDGRHNEPLPDILARRQNNAWVFRIGGTSEKLFQFTGDNPGNELFLHCDTSTHPGKVAALTSPHVIVLDGTTASIARIKLWMISYYKNSGKNPVILKRDYHENQQEKYSIRAAGELGLLLIDHLLGGIWLHNPNVSEAFTSWLSFDILQAARNRFTSTEYIACPSCGRTQFNIQSVLSNIKQSTSHLRGLKIAVMGCIVNGPVEMADADYGYVGAGRGLVSIYRGKKEILKKVPEEKAVTALVEVIKENGDWVDP